MSYNHGKEERKWLLWKEAEEKKFRKSGGDEGTIKQLLVDLSPGDAGEALALSFTALVQVPHHAVPATIGAEKCVASGAMSLS